MTGFLKPISNLLSDSDISEIMVNAFDTIYVEKKGKIFKASETFRDDDELMAAVRRIAQTVGKRIDEENPLLDARLPDGSRVNIVIPPSARNGIYISIRKFGQSKMTVKQLVDVGALSVAMAKFLNLCVALHKNMLVSGGTSSGKTTLLNIVSSLITPDERIVVIEDASELQLQQEHVLPLETRPADQNGKGLVSMRDLVKNSLRMRPDRIVIGEVRSAEAMDLLQAMNTGHDGSLATIHANTPKGALDRLETLAMMSDVDIPWRALRNQVASAIHIVIQAARLKDGSRKITHISEILGLDEDGKYLVNDIFKLNLQGKHEATGIIPSFLDEAQAQGFTIDEKMFTSGSPAHKQKSWAYSTPFKINY